jgi:GNAT superfamily N-acetyltransferase
MDIRVLENSDFETVIIIALSLPEWFTKSGVELIKKDIPFQKGFLAYKDDKVIGFLTFIVNQGIATIGWMGVLPSFHKKGIGSALIVELKKLLIKNNIHRILVSTLADSVEYEPYARTRAFYRKNGFVDYERIPHLNNPEQEEELILALDI